MAFLDGTGRFTYYIRPIGLYMHMALFRVRDGPISARVRPVQAEPLGPSRTLSNAICIFSHDINFLQI